MNEDEKVAALELALGREKSVAGAELPDPYIPSDVKISRALLDAVRLIRAHEYVLYNDSAEISYRECAGCLLEDAHEPLCEVGSWVRAAARAKLDAM